MKQSIKRYPKYKINTDGGIFSSYTERQLKGHYNYYGYKMVTLKGNDGKFKTEFVHNLMIEEFIGNKNGLQTRHLDGDKSNNSLSNLKLGTAKENADDREKHGNTARGERHSELIQLRKENAKLKKELSNTKKVKAPEMYEALKKIYCYIPSTPNTLKPDGMRSVVKSLLKEIES